MVDILAENLTNYLLVKKAITEEARGIIKYGFQVGLELMISTVTSILVAVYLHMAVECLLFFLIFVPIRSLAGGVHLESYRSCFVVSLTSLIGILLLVKYARPAMEASVAILLLSGIVIGRLAPVISNRRTITPEQKQKMSVRTRILLFVLGICNLGIAIFGNGRILWLNALTLALAACGLVVGQMKYAGEKRLM